MSANTAAGPLRTRQVSQDFVHQEIITTLFIANIKRRSQHQTSKDLGNAPLSWFFCACHHHHHPHTLPPIHAQTSQATTDHIPHTTHQTSSPAPQSLNATLPRHPPPLPPFRTTTTPTPFLPPHTNQPTTTHVTKVSRPLPTEKNSIQVVYFVMLTKLGGAQTSEKRPSDKRRRG